MTVLKIISFRFWGLFTILSSVYFLSCKTEKTKSISIQGRITDQYSGGPIAGVSVQALPDCSPSYGNWSGVSHTDAHAVSDVNGHYEIEATVAKVDKDCNNWQLRASTNSAGGLLTKDISLGGTLQGTDNFQFYSYATLAASASDTSGSPSRVLYIYISAPISTYGNVNTSPAWQLPCVTSTVNTVVCLLENSVLTVDTLRKQVYCPPNVTTSVVFKY